MEATLQNILHHEFDAFAAKHRQPLHKHKAVSSIRQCRTAALGGHVQRCPAGHIERICYNACKYRFCPKCCALPKQRWLDTQKAKLLDCDHYHVIFTLPHQLLDLWGCNTRVMVDLLFQTATATLTELLGDDKYLGAVPGIIASLHTWGRNLSRHPHLHCLISGGGYSPEKRWKAVNNGYLLPFQVVRALFRGKFLAALRRAYQRGQIDLPEPLTPVQFQNLLNQLGRKVKWNVHVRERYAHGQGVVTYLARYLKGGPIRNQQLLKVTRDQVVFRYTDHKDQQIKTQPLNTGEFIARWLWHLPEHRQQTVRYYGLYHARQKEKRTLCRQALGQAPEPAVPFLDWQTYWQTLGQPAQSQCSVCGQPLLKGAVLARVHSPPRFMNGKANS